MLTCWIDNMRWSYCAQCTLILARILNCDKFFIWNLDNSEEVTCRVVPCRLLPVCVCVYLITNSKLMSGAPINETISYTSPDTIIQDHKDTFIADILSQICRKCDEIIHFCYMKCITILWNNNYVVYIAQYNKINYVITRSIFLYRR